jgi:predicted transcriptional regulator
LAELETALAKGLADVDAGRVWDLEEVAEQLRRRYGGLAGVAEE